MHVKVQERVQTILSEGIIVCVCTCVCVGGGYSMSKPHKIPQHRSQLFKLYYEKNYESP